MLAKPVLAIVLTGLTLGSAASAAPFDNRPKILLHRNDVVSKNPCLAAGISDCATAVTSGDLNANSFVYVLIARGDLPNLGGVRFAIDYQDNCPQDEIDGARIDIHSWNSCSSSYITTGSPAWPEPGAGIVMLWNQPSDCQNAALVVGGYFYLSAAEPDTLYVTGVGASFATCDYSEVQLAQTDLGSLIFSSGGALSGCNPCVAPCQAPLPASGPANCKDEPPPPPPPPSSYSPKLLLHVEGVVTKNPCGSGQLAACADATTQAILSTPSGPFYFVYLLGAPGQAGNLASVLAGINYQNGAPEDLVDGTGVDIFGWTNCATAEYVRGTTHRWPEPGGANLIVWDYVNRCQSGATAVAGYFYLGAYTPDRLELIPDGLINAAQIVTCAIQEIGLDSGDLGFVEFSEAAKARGCNPCLVDCSGTVTVEPTTWSRLKTLVGD